MHPPQKKSVKPIHLWWLLALTFLLSCGRESNPFLDPSNAQSSIVYQSFGTHDTLSLFAPETLEVVVAVHELVDSVVITLPHNRFGSDTVFIRPRSSAYRLYYAPAETGSFALTLNTWRSSGDVVATVLPVVVRSPLRQSPDPVVLECGVPRHLSTVPVNADKIFYIWDLGLLGTISSLMPETSVVIYGNDRLTTQSHGRLYVRDLTGISSSSTGFTFSIIDTTPPVIICLSAVGTVPGDTIITNNTTFFFRVQIVDKGSPRLYQTLVNGVSFDLNEAPVYTRVLQRLDTVTGALPLTVTAIDSRTFGNRTSQTFYVRLGATIVRDSMVRLQIAIPPGDVQPSSSRNFFLAGDVELLSADSFYGTVKAKVNGIEEPIFIDLKGKYRIPWYFGVTLTAAINTLEVAIYDVNETVRADSTLYVSYAPVTVDTLPPRIVDVSISDRPANDLYVSSSTINLRVMVYDYGKPGTTVTINNAPAVVDPLSNGCLWNSVRPVVHSQSGNPFAIHAIDQAGHFADTIVTVYQNSPPFAARPLQSLLPVTAGSLYRDTLLTTDADHDVVTITKTAGPSAAAVMANGLIFWQTTLADTGTHLIRVVLDDGYEAVTQSFTVTVVSPLMQAPPVKFSTHEADFPLYLQAGRDTLKQILRYDSVGGMRPFTVSAVLAGHPSTIAARGDTIQWVPQAADTGDWQSIIIVRDVLGSADTLYPLMLVVPPNRDFSLRTTFTGDKRGGDTLDMSRATTADTLRLFIDDPDLPLVESHSVRILRDHVETVSSVSVLGFVEIIIDPSYTARATEALTITVRDIASHSHAAGFHIYYGNP